MRVFLSSPRSLLGALPSGLLGLSVLLGGCDRNEAVAKEAAGGASPTVEVAALETPAGATAAAPPRTVGDVHAGEATYYRATGEGNCSFEAADDLMVAAINTRDYAKAALCGAFLRVSGPRGAVTVRVVDRCPGCGKGGLDLSRQAFARVADPADGRVPVTWQVVSGPVSGPVAYHYMDGTTRYWTAVQIRNHRWPIAALEILPKGRSRWIPVKRRRYNYFVYPRPIAAGPVRIRLKAVTGGVIEDVLPEPASGLLVQGGAQFP
jgi:expansin (peptidoglycan-binding protein)